jgi:predicted nucleotidyltransferase
MIKTKIFEEILKVVSEVMKVAEGDILSPKRDREIAEARQVFVWFCKINGGCAKDIIRFINRKDKNCVTELVNNYHSNYASYTMYRIMSDKISRILPPILKKVEEEEKARDLAEIMANSTANSIPNETTK